MLLLLLAAFANAEPQWVDADVLNVREAPGGEVVARLISNDKVDVIERSGSFAHVRHEWGEGWVSSSFLTDRRVRNYDILRSERSSNADRLRAVDRLVVEYGGSASDRAQYAQQYGLVGDVDWEAAAGQAPTVHVAVCDGTDIIVAGVIPSTGPFESWEHLEGLKDRLSEVAIQRWYTEHLIGVPRFATARMDAQAMILRGD
jgi:hypothetical protein